MNCFENEKLVEILTVVHFLLK